MTDIHKFMLRMPVAVRDDISNAATASNRSMNAEIIHRLEGQNMKRQDLAAMWPDYDPEYAASMGGGFIRLARAGNAAGDYYVAIADISTFRPSYSLSAVWEYTLLMTTGGFAVQVNASAEQILAAIGVEKGIMP